MFHVVSTKKEIVSPKRAEELLKFNNYPAQRPLKDKTVNQYVEKMEDGRFIGDTVTVILAENGSGEQYVMNGQHCLHSIIRHGKPVKINVMNVHCENQEDMATLFNQCEGKPRNLKDSIKAMSHAMGLDWPLKLSSLVVSGATYVKGSTFHVKADIDERTRLIKEYEKFGNYLYTLLGDPENGGMSKSSKHLWRAPVVAIIINTWKKSKSDCDAFWIGVRDGDNLSKKDPRLLLRDFLLSIVLNDHGGQGGKVVTRKEVMARCIIAWNAFRDGSTLKILKYHSSASLPKIK